MGCIPKEHEEKDLIPILCPSKPGLGQIILRSQPLVIPFFINGLSNSFVSFLKDNWKKNSKTNPIIIVYGQPMDYGQYLTSEPSDALYQHLSEDVLNQIRALMPREKEIREACLMGQISNHDPRWFKQSASKKTACNHE